MALSLDEFIHSLDLRTLPRVLEIQSGIYLEGSVYEMFGNECCLSTGEVIKIIGLKIKKIIAEICEHRESGQSSRSFELPMNFPGLFKIVADKTPYLTMEEIIRTIHIGPGRLGHPYFYHQKDIQLENIIIKQGEHFTLNAVEEINGEMMVNCGVNRNHQNHSFTLPLSQEGHFFECEDEHIYTLKEIVEWKIPKNRARTVKLTDVSKKWDSTNPFPKGFYGSLILKPVYEIQGVMKFQKDIVHLLPSLDVEVKDITDRYEANWFLQLLSTEDLFEMTSKEFPVVAEVIEGPEGKKLPGNILQSGKTIVIHKKYQASRILASEIRSNFPKRHFLIPMSYKGKFKRRPREFPTAYDLEIAKSEKEPLHVVATKAFHSPYDELSSISVGDQFVVHHSQSTEVLCKKGKKALKVLACEKILRKSYEATLLPLYTEGGFVEVIHDKKQYQISELCTQFRLPFNVKVSVRDLSIEEDTLAATPGLQLEEDITDSYLLVSDFSNPSECWEIPISRLNMTVHLVSNLLRETESFSVRTLVEEISEEQYYMMRRYESSFLLPPPLPPKHPLLVEAKSTLLTQPEQRRADLPKSPKSHHVDMAKKPHSSQAGPNPKEAGGCQNNSAYVDRERSKSGTTATADTNVTTDMSVISYAASG
ncbi:protein THEMIS [Echinops telfairi]|uniref:Protein THEMIS n=1 Tax=Echinops telfairi TaxID=9371 RepID=A0ABM1VL09_ECHTE|nr:protein THEMIS [Echinops telfairi]